MKHAQFTAIVLMTLLAMKLLLLPRKVAVNGLTNKSRWLMVGGIILIDVQFVLQYTLGLRAMGVCQAVMVNLLMFVPVSWLLSLAVLYLQKAHTTTLEKLAGPVAWVVVVALIGTAAAIDGQPLFSSTPELKNAEAVGSFIYAIMQLFYTAKHLINLIKMRSTLQNYYDSERIVILGWMQVSIMILMVLAVMAPVLIFGSGIWLAVYTLIFFGGIFYFVDNFCGYVVSSAPMKMQEAEDKGETQASADNKTVDEPLKGDAMLRVEHAVTQWTEMGGYRKCGITMPMVADEMRIPRYLLSTWLKQKGTTYASWMTDLRVDEAKRVLKAHPEWSNESIANHCGFSDRTYFQKKFKEKTGLSPSDFLTNSH